MSKGKDQHKEESSIVKAQEDGKKNESDKRRLAASKSLLRRGIAWFIGVAFALFPVVVALFGALIYKDDTEMLSHYIGYVASFFDSGSFLWFAISLVVMSLVDLILYGFKEELLENGVIRSGPIGIVIFIGLFCLFSIVIYFSNIAHPMNVTVFRTLSVGVAVLFGFASHYVSFKLLREE